MPETYHNYVGGDWVESAAGETFEVRNPADTTDLIGAFQRSTGADAEAAVEAAVAAKEGWADTPGPERGRLLARTARHLEDRADELAETLTREEGKTLAEARAEVGRAVDIFHYYAGKAADHGGIVRQSSSGDTRLFTVSEPMGVAALITPWNYPIAIPSWKMAPALATGNVVVLKPAENAPNVVRKLVECLESAGIPDGVVNFVTGPGSEVGARLVDHEEVDVLSFTGSRGVGETVYEEAAAAGKRAQTEMGSKNPTVVMPSADVEGAATIVGAGAFGVTGQACTATERAVVHEAVHDEFVDRLITYAEGLDVGPGLDGADMGPKVSEDELEGTLEYVEVGQKEGATLAYGGRRLGDEPEAGEAIGDGAGVEGRGQYDDGYFVEPTIFTDVTSDMRIAQEEVFGPFVGVIEVADFDEAIDVTNDVDFGLSAGIVTNDHGGANRFVDEVDFGVVKVNEMTTGLELHVPFGGMKASSSETWREQGDAALDFYTITKTVYERYRAEGDVEPAVDAE